MTADLTIASVTVSRVLTGEDGDESDIVRIKFEGEPSLIEALGMLRMAENELLNGEDDA